MRIPDSLARLDLAQAVAHEPDTVHQQPIRRALDLKVAEESVRTEQGEHFIEDVVAFAVWVGRFEGWHIAWGESVGGTAGLGTEREQREVAD